MEDFPKCSPDLNHIEGVWLRVRQELDENAPAGRETRPQFPTGGHVLILYFPRTHQGSYNQIVGSHPAAFDGHPR